MNQTATTSQPLPHAAPFSSGGTLVQVSSVLAVIILLILFCAWLAKRLGFTPGRGIRGEKVLHISDSCTLGQRERVVIVDAEDVRLVLGVTAQQITLLHTLPPRPPEVDNNVAAPAKGDFNQLLQRLMKNAGKKS